MSPFDVKGINMVQLCICSETPFHLIQPMFIVITQTGVIFACCMILCFLPRKYRNVREIKYNKLLSILVLVDRGFT